MRRDYVIRPRAAPEPNGESWGADGENYLARTVYEEHDLVDIGIMDPEGNPIMARKRIDPIGFIRWPERN